jgi:hypothetical protein
MKAVAPILVHVGLPKTATKTLQSHVFGRHPEILNLGVPYKSESLRMLGQAMAYLDRSEFDAGAYRALINSETAELGPAHKAVVYSEERLTLPTVDRLTVAERIKDVFGSEATILFVVRNQLDWIASYYFGTRNQSRRFCKWLPNAFESWMEVHLQQYLHRLKYHETYDTYVRLFGEKNVHVLLYEAMKENQAVYFKSICSLIGVDQKMLDASATAAHENAFVSTRYLMYWRFRRRVLPTLKLRALVPGAVAHRFNRYLHGPRETLDYSASTKETLSNMFRESNRRLADLGLPVARYGYPV